MGIHGDEINWVFMVCGGRVAQNFTRVGARHGECDIQRVSSDHKCDYVSWGDFGGHMKSDMKNFGDAHETDNGAEHLSPHNPPKMALTGDIASPLFAHLEDKITT